MTLAVYSKYKDKMFFIGLLIIWFLSISSSVHYGKVGSKQMMNQNGLIKKPKSFQKKMKNFFNEVIILIKTPDISIGIANTVIKMRYYPCTPKSLVRDAAEKVMKDLSAYDPTLPYNPTTLQKNELEKLYMASMRASLINTKENKEFIKVFDHNIKRTSDHPVIVDSFFKDSHNLANNLLEEHFKQKKMSGTDIQNTLKLCQQDVRKSLTDGLKKFRENQIMNYHKKPKAISGWGLANNQYFANQQDAIMHTDLERILDPAFNTIPDENSLNLQSYVMNADGYEGLGKTQINLNFLNSKCVTRLPFFGSELDIEPGYLLQVSFFPRKNFNPLNYLDINLNLLLKVPDVLNVFPSDGFIYAKQFIGIGFVMNKDLLFEMNSCVVFRFGIGGIGFVQMNIIRSLYSTIRLIKGFGNSIEDFFKKKSNKTNKTRDLIEFFNSTYSVSLERTDFTVGKSTKQNRSSIQKLLQS